MHTEAYIVQIFFLFFLCLWKTLHQNNKNTVDFAQKIREQEMKCNILIAGALCKLHMHFLLYHFLYAFRNGSFFEIHIGLQTSSQILYSHYKTG